MVKRLIDADAALAKVCENCNCDWEECKRTCFCVDYDNINQLPTVDAVEVVHGRWENITGGMIKLGDCSECKKRQPELGTNFCSNCGAKMDGGKDER